MATLKEIFEGNTADILEATELLKVLGDREGQYVWKKCIEKQVKFTQLTNSANPTVLQAESNTFDLSKVDASWFAGLKGTYTVDNKTANWEFTSDTQMRLSDAVDANFTYDPTTAKVSIAYSLSSRVWNESFGENAIVGYVTADSADAYPNGGELDGYWYELVKEGISAEGFGYSKMDVVSFTPSSDTKVVGYTINHNLETTPKMVMVYASGALSKTKALATFTYNTEWVISGITGDNAQYGALITSNPTGSSTSASATMKKMLTLNTNSISFTNQGNNDSWIFASGVKYVCEVFA